MFWLLFSTIALCLAYLGQAGKDKYIFRTLLVIVLAYVVGFGGIVGTDSYSYVVMYNQTDSLYDIFDFSFENYGVSRDSEFGFNVMCYLGHILNLAPPGFFFAVACLINFLFVKAIYKFPYPVITILIYFTSIVYGQQTNLIRQSIVIAFFVYSIHYLVEKKWLPYLITLLFCATVHLSAIILLPLIVLCFWDLKKYGNSFRVISFVFWGISLLIAKGIIPIFDLMNTLLSFLVADSVYDIYSLDETLGASVGIDLMINLFCLFTLLFHKEEKKLPYVLCIVVACALLNMSVSMPALKRIGYYFLAVSIVYVGNLLVKRENASFISKNATILFSVLIVLNYVVKNLILNNIILGTNIVGSDFYPLTQFFE